MDIETTGGERVRIIRYTDPVVLSLEFTSESVHHTFVTKRRLDALNAELLAQHLLEMIGKS